jgi:hypothetical protein
MNGTFIARRRRLSAEFANAVRSKRSATKLDDKAISEVFRIRARATAFPSYLFKGRMNAVDINMAHREVASPEELEEWDFHEREARIPTFPKSWNRDMFLMIPDAMGRSEWEQRSPSLGLNNDIIQDLEQHASNPLLLDVQRRILFQHLRHGMLQQLIDCSGAGSVHALSTITTGKCLLGKR